MTVAKVAAAEAAGQPAALKKRVISFKELADCLQNTSGQELLPARFRALFALKSIGGPKVIDVIEGGTFWRCLGVA